MRHETKKNCYSTTTLQQKGIFLRDPTNKSLVSRRLRTLSACQLQWNCSRKKQNTSKKSTESCTQWNRIYQTQQWQLIDEFLLRQSSVFVAKAAFTS